MIPDLPIYRRNEKMGEFYVIFDKEQINIMQEKFMSKNYINNVNEMHDGSKKLDGIIEEATKPAYDALEYGLKKDYLSKR